MAFFALSLRLDAEVDGGGGERRASGPVGLFSPASLDGRTTSLESYCLYQYVASPPGGAVCKHNACLHTSCVRTSRCVQSIGRSDNI